MRGKWHVAVGSRTLAAAVLVTLAVSGCSGSLLEGKKIDYKSAGKLPPLEVPPDLTQPTGNDRFAVPDMTPQGSATFSAYNQERGSQPTAASAPRVLPQVEKARVERAGMQRWLVVQATPDAVWAEVKAFWQENGFILKIDNPQAGVMETDWAENRAKIPQDAIRNILGKMFDGLYSTAERDKFRTRVERGENGQTEVYISHRGMLEVYENDKKDRTVWQPRVADPELEAEFLNRLLQRFGVEENRSKTLLASDGVTLRARLVKQDQATLLAVSDNFDRAWRRLGLALDRIGFTVEDRNRADGVYFVRYVDPDIDNGSEKKGFLNSLAFWRRDEAKPEPKQQFQLQLSPTATGSEVRILDRHGKPENTPTTQKILNLLLDQLK